MRSSRIGNSRRTACGSKAVPPIGRTAASVAGSIWNGVATSGGSLISVVAGAIQYGAPASSGDAGPPSITGSADAGIAPTSSASKRGVTANGDARSSSAPGIAVATGNTDASGAAEVDALGDGVSTGDATDVALGASPGDATGIDVPATALGVDGPSTAGGAA